MQKSLILLVGLFILLGCASEKEYKEIRDRRMAGQLAESRSLALSVLEDNPKNLTVWRELSRTDLEISKKARMEKVENSMPALVEASLICAAMYQHKKLKPDVRWKQASLLTYAEVNAQLNILLAQMIEQTKLGFYLNDLMNDKTVPLGKGRTQTAASEKVEDARDQARFLMKNLGVVLAFTELLPETNGGTTKIMLGQAKDHYQKWVEALSLEGPTMDQLQEQAKTAVKNAVKTAQEDLATYKYYQAATITENGIY